MKKIDIRRFSGSYAIRKMTDRDADAIFRFCKANTQYYEYCGKEITIQRVKQDLSAAPPGIPPEQKHYVGFYQEEKLMAILDLIDGYPEEACAYIGFFMMNSEMQGKNLGSQIMSDVFAYLKSLGFSRCMLGMDRDNPQANHFWKKNGFRVTREVWQEEGVILVAEKEL